MSSFPYPLSVTMDWSGRLHPQGQTLQVLLSSPKELITHFLFSSSFLPLTQAMQPLFAGLGAINTNIPSKEMQTGSVSP